ncbi:MAG: outer membrane beta-barrel protein [Nitrospira sp.]|nr:outer membrane beta-barrel protein [Nitrospira sp.]
MVKSSEGSHIVFRVGALSWCSFFVTAVLASAAFGQDPTIQPSAAPTPQEPVTSTRDWHYGAYVDVGYIGNFNFPDNHLWHSRTTAFQHNELSPNMGLAYVRKDVTESSRWGMELGFQGGRDSEEFAFLVGERRVDGSDVLRHVHRANVSYLAQVGNGLTITAGLFNSLMGYESLYARDNVNYTRSWIADNTPYMMFGVNAQYPVNDALTVTAFVVNSYYHLAHPNDLPSYGSRWIWKARPRLTLMQTFYAGPNQTDTSLEFWRLYGNHILEWKGDEVTVAASFDIGTERIAGQPGLPRAFVMGGNVVVRWHLTGPWSVAVRPEFYWDRNGRWTGSEQFVKAITSTIEYKFPYKWTNTVVRVEHRYDDSTGVGGGFFKNGGIRPDVVGLAREQHLLLLGLLVSFDSP